MKLMQWSPQNFCATLNYLLFTFVCLSVTAEATAAGAITEPEKLYYYANDTRGAITAQTMSELIGKINAQAEVIFSGCISKPIYNCSMSVITHAEGSDLFGWTNGEHRQYSLIRYFHNKSRNSAGVVSSNDQPTNGNLGASVQWKCPDGYSSRAESVGANSTKLTCIILVGGPKNKGPSDGGCPSSYGGNPINFSVGNKYQQEIDYHNAGPANLEFSRAYNSLDGYWRHNFSMRLEFDLPRNTIYLTRETGRLSTFGVSNGVITPEAIELGKLVSIDDQWVYTSPNNDKFTFDDDGILIRQEYLSGIERSLTYSQGNIVVTDNFGSSLEFTEDERGQPLSFQSGSAQGTYTYNQDKRLEQVVLTSGGVTRARLYHYEDSRNLSLLTGITDERGVRFATWAYDDKGRAISSEHAGGVEKIQISYDSSTSTSVTNEFGKITKYTFRDFSGLKRIASIVGEPSANCPNSNSSYGYNSRGQLTSKTDNKGYRTNYVYNTRGLESSRTEAFGTPQARTITTEWHPTMFLPLVVTEPKRIIRYQYDNQGRQLSRTVEAR